MLVTTIPTTLDAGGELLYLARADRLVADKGRVAALECLAMDACSVAPTGRKIKVRARHYILAGGGINTPAILLRSDAPDPHQRTGKRTFLHLVNFPAAQFEKGSTRSTARASQSIPTISNGTMAPAGVCPTSLKYRPSVGGK